MAWFGFGLVFDLAGCDLVWNGLALDWYLTWLSVIWFGFGLLFNLAGCDLVWYGMSAVGSLFVSLHPSTLPCVIWFHLGLVCYYLGLYSMVSFSLAWYDMG